MTVKVDTNIHADLPAVRQRKDTLCVRRVSGCKDPETTNTHIPYLINKDEARLLVLCGLLQSASTDRRQSTCECCWGTVVRR